MREEILEQYKESTHHMEKVRVILIREREEDWAILYHHIAEVKNRMEDIRQLMEDELIRMRHHEC